MKQTIVVICFTPASATTDISSIQHETDFNQKWNQPAAVDGTSLFQMTPIRHKMTATIPVILHQASTDSDKTLPLRPLNATLVLTLDTKQATVSTANQDLTDKNNDHIQNQLRHL